MVSIVKRQVYFKGSARLLLIEETNQFHQYRQDRRRTEVMKRAAEQAEHDMLNKYGRGIKDHMIYIPMDRNLPVDRNSSSAVIRSSGIQFLHF